MIGPPRLPVGDDRGNRFEFGSLEIAFHGGSQQVAPQALGFLIDHHQAALPEHPGNGEVQTLVLDLSGIHDAVVT